MRWLTLSEKKLAKIILAVLSAVLTALQGFCREDGSPGEIK